MPVMTDKDDNQGESGIQTNDQRILTTKGWNSAHIKGMQLCTVSHCTTDTGQLYLKFDIKQHSFSFPNYKVYVKRLHVGDC